MKIKFRKQTLSPSTSKVDHWRLKILRNHPSKSPPKSHQSAGCGKRKSFEKEKESLEILLLLLLLQAPACARADRSKSGSRLHPSSAILKLTAPRRGKDFDKRCLFPSFSPEGSRDQLGFYPGLVVLILEPTTLACLEKKFTANLVALDNFRQSRLERKSFSGKPMSFENSGVFINFFFLSFMALSFYGARAEGLVLQSIFWNYRISKLCTARLENKLCWLRLGYSWWIKNEKTNLLSVKTINTFSQFIVVIFKKILNTKLKKKKLYYTNK